MFERNMTSHAAPTDSLSLCSLPETRNMSAGRLFSAFYRYWILLHYSSSPFLTYFFQEDSPDTLHIIVAFLLMDGRRDEKTYEMMNEEGVFPRLLELIMERKDDESGLHRMLLELLYEMSRIQRLRIQDLGVYSPLDEYPNI